MKKLLLLALVFSTSQAVFAQAEGVIISEIVDGNELDGVPRYVEITNAHPWCDAELKEFVLRRYADGGQFCAHTQLTDVVLKPGESYIVAAAQFDTTWGGPYSTRQADLIDITANGNGNDVYELIWVNPENQEEEIVDMYGVMGVTSEAQEWHFIDHIVQRNLNVVDNNDGAFSMSEWGMAYYATDLATPGWRAEFAQTSTSVEVEELRGFALAQNYPNPFNPSTSFTVAVDEQQEIEIGVYDALGRQIELLFSGTALPNQTLELNFTAPSGLPSGLYLYRASGQFGTITKQMTLLK